MAELLVLTGGANATAELLVDAAAVLGIRTTLVDLRRQQLDVMITADGGKVTTGGRSLQAGVVINTTSANSLGLAGIDALTRQQSMRWARRNAAVREEQGLLLGALAALRLQGARLVNSPEAADLALMPNAVTERLGRRGVAVNRGTATGSTTELLVVSGEVINRKGPQLDDAAAALAVSAEAEFVVGSVSIATRSNGRQVVTGWDHQPNLLDWPDPAATAERVLRSFPELNAGEQPSIGNGSGFFVEDLGRP